MTTTRLLTLTLLLSALPALAGSAKKRPEDHVQGKEIWERSCWYCHGEANDGQGPAAGSMNAAVPDLRGAIAPQGYDDLVALILNGSTTHPAFNTEMDRHQARRILVYLNRLDRERKGAPAPPQEAPEEEAPEDDAPAE